MKDGRVDPSVKTSMTSCELATDVIPNLKCPWVYLVGQTLLFIAVAVLYTQTFTLYLHKDFRFYIKFHVFVDDW